MTDPHRRTLAVYDARAGEWEQRRSADLEPAREFTRWVSATGEPCRPGRVVDLGCGPGWHVGALPDGTVALDGSAAMLDLAATHAPDAPRIRADLRALPFARGSLDAAWAERSYVHLDRRQVPMAMWDLHRAVRVGGSVHLGLFGDDIEHGQIDGDDFPGRSYSAWPEPLLRAVLSGAGFDVELLEHRGGGDVDRFTVWARRARTLADTVGPDMRLLLVGLNPSLVAADAGVGFHRAGNRAWPALLAAGLATVDRDPVHLLRQHRVGMTDLVKAASPRADVLTAAQFAEGIDRLDVLCAWLRPAAVCIVGLGGWRLAVDRRATTGVQERRLGGRPVYVMPNPSGVNAHVGVDDLAAHFAAAARLADEHGGQPDSAGVPA
jgi:TDG/mug DNA glycosylase family protein